MPVYEYLCSECNERTDVFVRQPAEAVRLPDCPKAPGNPAHQMQRIISSFSRRLTDADKLAEAEAKYGAEVEAVMGRGPDVESLARRYDRLSKDLPTE